MINIEEFKIISESVLKYNAHLVAVSKTKPIPLLKAVYDQGHRIFGENRVQELVEKEPLMPDDTEWHMIGHLQSNKVKYIAPFISMIQSVDSLKLLNEIDKQAKKNNRKINILLQFHIAEESAKYGFSIEEIEEEMLSFENVHICGVMGMATFSSDLDLVRTEFQSLRKIFETLKNTYFKDDEGFSEISMGMSGDYKTALEEGSTLIRVGSLIFGSR